MTTELFSIGAEAWVLVAVAGAGIVVLPWSSGDVQAVSRAFATTRRLLRVVVRWAPDARSAGPGPELVAVPAHR
jgi:hypothetical protein